MGRKKYCRFDVAEEPLYIGEKRYEYWSKTGKVFTEWFKLCGGNDKDVVKSMVDNFKANCVGNKVKLKEEFRVIDNSEKHNAYLKFLDLQNECEEKEKNLKKKCEKIEIFKKSSILLLEYLIDHNLKFRRI